MPKLFARAASALTVGLCLLGAVNLPSVISASTVYAADFQEKGNVDGYYYEVWQQNYVGEINYENTENNGFSASWKNIENTLAMKGESFERNKTFASQLKEYNVTYDADIDYMGQNNFCSVYGWMEKPDFMAEFYIVDSWGSWRPQGNGYDGKDYGSFESNGVTYDIYRSIISQMSCFGDGTPIRYIYYSVARDNQAEKIDGTCNIKNTVNVADHFKAWSEAGLELGYLYDIVFSAESYRSSGSVDLKSLDITKEITEQTNYGPKFANEKHDPLEPDEEGRTVFIDFETDNEKVGAADEKCQTSYSTDHSFSGERSMLISAENNDQRTFVYEIDPYDFKGKDMLGGVRLYHDSDDDVKFTFKIVRAPQDGNEYEYSKYSKTVAPDHWASMELIPFPVNLDRFTRYYVEISAFEPVDFYVDDLYIYDKGEYNDFLNSENAIIRGDINRDKVVDMFDVIALRRELLDAGDFSIDAVHDINGDCKLDISDLVLLSRFVLGQADAIPEPELRTEFYMGDFHKEENDQYYTITASGENADTIKTALRENGTFMAEWNNVDLYEALISQGLDDYDELSVKYSGEAVIDPKSIIYKSSHLTVSIMAEFRKDGRPVNVFFTDGADDNERLRWLANSDDMECVTIGGKEYYVDKANMDSELFDPVYWLYPKENSIVCDGACSFEGEVDFAEILKYYGLEDYKPSEIRCKFSAEQVWGHIDFKELSFLDKSKNE